MSDIITRTITSPLGDTIKTTVSFLDGRFMREDITIEGPPELVGISGSDHGKNWYAAGERERRAIWLANRGIM